jgi:hypothetical protein
VIGVGVGGRELTGVRHGRERRNAWEGRCNACGYWYVVYLLV